MWDIPSTCVDVVGSMKITFKGQRGGRQVDESIHLDKHDSDLIMCLVERLESLHNREMDEVD